MKTPFATALVAILFALAARDAESQGDGPEFLAYIGTYTTKRSKGDFVGTG